MLPDGTPDINDVTKAAEAGAGLTKPIGKLFPGFALRSALKAESKATDRMLADLQKIKDAQKPLGISDESLAELMGNAVQRYSRNVNFDAVITFAEEMTTEDADPSVVDRDWAEHFRDHAEKAYDDKVRKTWAAILAGEINKPGSFSKRTMSILSDMGKSEAESFAKLCSYSTGLVASDSSDNTFVINPFPVLVRDAGGSSFNEGNISLPELSTLDSLGLIDQSLLNVQAFPEGIPFLLLADDALIIVKNEGPEKKVDFPGAVFRSAGLELARICNIGCAPDLSRILSAFLEEKGLKVTLCPFATESVRQL